MAHKYSQPIDFIELTALLTCHTFICLRIILHTLISSNWLHVVQYDRQSGNVVLSPLSGCCVLVPTLIVQTYNQRQSSCNPPIYFEYHWLQGLHFFIIEEISAIVICIDVFTLPKERQNLHTIQISAHLHSRKLERTWFMNILWLPGIIE